MIEEEKNEFVRNCPMCNNIMCYQSKGAMMYAEKINCVCRKCVGFKISKTQSKNPQVWSNEKRLRLSKKFKGENNPYYGKKHSAEVREKMKKSHKDYSGENNPYYGKKHSAEVCEKMSKSHSKRISNGLIHETKNGRGYKGWYISTKMKTNFYYDSILEKFRMTQLDSDMTVSTWTKRHGISIQYTDGNNKRNYIPDFLIHQIDGSTIIEEVKGYDVKAEKKKSALVEYCTTHKIQCRWLNQGSKCLEGYRDFLKKEKEKNIK